MGVKKALLLGLVIVLALTTLAVVGCGGGGSDAKAQLSTALDKVEADIAGLTTRFTAGGTVPELKKAKDEMKPDWQAVVDAAKKVKGADAAAAEKAWADVDAAVSGLADNATLIQAAGTIMAPLQNLQKVDQDLRKLAPSTATTKK
jgi:hypothetical protein